MIQELRVKVEESELQTTINADEIHMLNKKISKLKSLLEDKELELLDSQRLAQAYKI